MVVDVVRMLSALLLTLGLVLVDISAPSALSPRADVPSHHLRDGFRNVAPDYVYPLIGRALRTLRLAAAREAKIRLRRFVVFRTPLGGDGRVHRRSG